SQTTFSVPRTRTGVSEDSVAGAWGPPRRQAPTAQVLMTAATSSGHGVDRTVGTLTVRWPSVTRSMLAALSFRVYVSDLVRRASGWWAVGAAVSTSAVFGVLALRLAQPAFGVASSCILILAVSLVVRLIAWVAASGATFGREERLVSFVALLAIGFG